MQQHVQVSCAVACVQPSQNHPRRSCTHTSRRRGACARPSNCMQQRDPKHVLVHQLELVTTQSLHTPQHKHASLCADTGAVCMVAPACPDPITFPAHSSKTLTIPSPSRPLRQNSHKPLTTLQGPQMQTAQQGCTSVQLTCCIAKQQPVGAAGQCWRRLLRTLWQMLPGMAVAAVAGPQTRLQRAP